MAEFAHYKEAHPLPFVITHYVNLVCMIVLIFTGFCIHFPFFPGFMGVARGAHIFCGIVITLNCIVRVVLAFLMKSAPANGTRQVDTDVKNFLPSPDNKGQFIQTIKFYLFIKKDHPLTGKFNSLQKLAYFLVPFLILFMAYTGFCLWEPTMDLPIFAIGVSLAGGAMSMRIIHYFMMFVFIIFMIIHVYMAIIEGGMPLMKIMFLRKEHGGLTYDIETHSISGRDDSI